MFWVFVYFGILWAMYKFDVPNKEFNEKYFLWLVGIACVLTAVSNRYLGSERPGSPMEKIAPYISTVEGYLFLHPYEDEPKVRMRAIISHVDGAYYMKSFQLEGKRSVDLTQGSTSEYAGCELERSHGEWECDWGSRTFRFRW